MYKDSKIYKYLNSNPMSSDIEHLQYCKDFLLELNSENPNIRYLTDSCPSGFGIDEFDGLCYTEQKDDFTTEQVCKMCDRCWVKALEIKEEKSMNITERAEELFGEMRSLTREESEMISKSKESMCVNTGTNMNDYSFKQEVIDLVAELNRCAVHVMLGDDIKSVLNSHVLDMWRLLKDDDISRQYVCTNVAGIRKAMLMMALLDGLIE